MRRFLGVVSYLCSAEPTEFFSRVLEGGVCAWGTNIACIICANVDDRVQETSLEKRTVGCHPLCKVSSSPSQCIDIKVTIKAYFQKGIVSLLFSCGCLVMLCTVVGFLQKYGPGRGFFTPKELVQRLWQPMPRHRGPLAKSAEKHWLFPHRACWSDSFWKKPV